MTFYLLLKSIHPDWIDQPCFYFHIRLPFLYLLRRLFCRRRHLQSMHRIVTRLALAQTPCLSCRKVITEKAAGFFIAPLHKPLRVLFPSPQRWRAYHAPSRALPTLGSHHDTIYALSSASGKAGIAVIRISGSACTQVSRIGPI